MTHIYGDGNTALGANQIQKHLFERKALVEASQERYFGQLANTKNMPKNMGKAIKQYRYTPLIDDRNLSDMGINAQGVQIRNGNLYGSATDIGLIVDKLPTLGELGGRVNKVSMHRVELTSTLHNFGMFQEYTKDMMDFDSDSELDMHLNREMLHGAMKVDEDKLQIDLLTNAGLIKYTGSATTPAQLDHTMQLTYADLVKLGIDLDKNKCPKQTKIMTGTRLIDTKTIPDCRVAYVGSELIPTLEAMVDYHGKQAFTPAHQYASGTTLLKGEVGRIAGFRIVVVPHMMKWGGVGANATDNSFYRTNGKYDVFPFLVVGDEAFTPVGLEGDGNKGKFEIIHKKPNQETASETNPYGKKGFYSIQWWYGFMPQFIERLALIKCTAKM